MSKTKRTSANTFADNLTWFEVVGDTFPGNILKPHGRNHTTLLCWKFSEDPTHIEATKKYFSELAHKGLLTSAKQQAAQSAEYRAAQSQELFMGLYLTASGLHYLEWPTDNNGLIGLTFSNDFPGGSYIDTPYKQQIDGVLYLAHDQKPRLIEATRYYRAYLEQILGAKLVTFENGTKLKNQAGQSIEPFGYPDEISRPAFLEANTQAVKPIEQIAVPEPSDEFTGNIFYGSYLTYLKMEQDLREFKKLEHEITGQLTADGSTLNNTVGEMVVGRRLDGSPLAGTNGKDLDDFDYAKDKGGLQCPFHAHIRKMNPRDDKNPVPLIVRRGVPYGIPAGNYSGSTSGTLGSFEPTGLLFLSFQRGMDAFMHFWNKAKQTTTGEADNTRITGADPLIGHADEVVAEDRKNDIFQHTYPVKNGSSTQAVIVPGFGGVTKLKAALQLYAPSIQFFKTLDPSAATKGLTSTKKTVNMANKILKPFKLFGSPDESFLQTLIYYHTVKAAVDSGILAYTYNDETHGPGKPPPDKQGYLEKYTEGLGENDKLAFEFFFPIRKGDHVCLKAEMVDWETEKVIAIHYNDLNSPNEPRNGKWVDFKAEYTPIDQGTIKPEVQIIFKGPNENHGYCRMLMVSNNGDTLQKILTDDLAGKELKRYIMRVKSKVFPYETSTVPYLREDNVLIVIKTRSAVA